MFVALTNPLLSPPRPVAERGSAKHDFAKILAHQEDHAEHAEPQAHPSLHHDLSHARPVHREETGHPTDEKNPEKSGEKAGEKPADKTSDTPEVPLLAAPLPLPTALPEALLHAPPRAPKEVPELPTGIDIKVHLGELPAGPREALNKPPPLVVAEAATEEVRETPQAEVSALPEDKDEPLPTPHVLSVETPTFHLPGEAPAPAHLPEVAEVPELPAPLPQGLNLEIQDPVGRWELGVVRDQQTVHLEVQPDGWRLFDATGLALPQVPAPATQGPEPVLPKLA